MAHRRSSGQPQRPCSSEISIIPHKYTNDRGLKAAAEFSAMTAALQTNDHEKSRRIAEGLIKDHAANSPYADQAQLTLARLDVDENHLDIEAIAPLTQVMNGSKDSGTAADRAPAPRTLPTDQGKSEEAVKLLADPIPAAFAAPYHEVRGDAYLAKKVHCARRDRVPASVRGCGMQAASAPAAGTKSQDWGQAGAEPEQCFRDTLKKAKP